MGGNQMFQEPATRMPFASIMIPNHQAFASQANSAHSHCGIGPWMLICANTPQEDAENPRASNAQWEATYESQSPPLLLLKDGHSQGACPGPDRTVDLQKYLNTQTKKVHYTVVSVMAYLYDQIKWI